jgi:AcrR family transcriptional regulator
MDATIDLAARVGYLRLTMEGVAAEAGVGKATIYRWWPSKASLVVEAIHHRVDLAPVEATGDLKTDVRALIQRLIDLFVKSPLGHIVSEIAADLANEPAALARLVELFGPTRAGHLSVLYGAAGRAELPHDIDANLILDLLCGTVLYRHVLGHRTDAGFVEQLTGFIVERQLPRIEHAHDGQEVS